MPGGTPSELKIHGLPFDLAADVDMSEVIGEYENTMDPTSGENSLSQTKRVVSVGGVVIVARPGDLDLLEGIQDSGKIGPLSYKHRDGTSHKSVGTINIESNSTAKNRVTMSLLPTRKWTRSLP